MIVGRTVDGDYLAISKAGPTTIWLTDVKARVRAMAGTEVLTYTVDAPGHGTAGYVGTSTSP